jgi:hypothetical protein
MKKPTTPINTVRMAFQMTVASMSAIPCPQGFVDAGVGVVGCFRGSILLLVPEHSRAKRLPSSSILLCLGVRRWRLEPRLPWIGSVVGSAAFGVEATGL